MNCIKCSCEMETCYLQGGFRYKTCKNCIGKWISGEIIKEYCSSFWVDGENKAFKHFMDKPLKSTKRPCPECDNSNLTLVSVSNYEVEYCVKCQGVYFDYGEVLNTMPTGKHSIQDIEGYRYHKTEERNGKFDLLEFIYDIFSE